MNAARQQAEPESTRAPITFLATAHIVNDAYGTVYPVLVPFLMVLLHWSVTVATLAGAIGWMAQAAQPFLGRLVDARPGRYYVAFALLVISVAVLAEPFSRNFFLFLAVILVATLASSLFHPPALAQIGRDSRRSQIMPVFLVSGNVGRAVGPLATSALIVLAGHHISGAAVIALPGLVLAGMAWMMAPRFQMQQAHVGPAIPVKAVIRNRTAPLTALLGLTGIRSLVGSGLLAMLPIWFHLQGHTELKAGLYLAVLLFVGSLGNGLGGWLMVRWPRWVLFFISTVGTGIAFLLFVGSTGLLSLVLIGLIGLFSMAPSSLNILIGQELMPESRGMGSGIALGLGNSVGALFVAALSFVAGHYGIPTALYVIGILTLTTVPLSFLYGGWTHLDTRFREGQTA
jgi:FSR family fosmidomycin resistance protein-like MFS transporter